MWERATGTRREHTVALYDVEARARPRALALAIAELIRQRKAEPGLQGGTAANPTPERLETANIQRPFEPPPPQSAPPTTYLAELGRDPPRGPELLLAGQGRFFAAESTLLFGANLAGSLPLGAKWLHGRVDLGANFASLHDPLGQVSMGIYSGGFSLLASTSQGPELFVGPHLELGYAYATATPTGPRSQARDDGRFVAMASFMAGTRLRLGRWAAALELDFGASLRGVEVFADDRRIAATQGIFAGARAGVAYEY